MAYRVVHWSGELDFRSTLNDVLVYTFNYTDYFLPVKYSGQPQDHQMSCDRKNTMLYLLYK